MLLLLTFILTTFPEVCGNGSQSIDRFLIVTFSQSLNRKRLMVALFPACLA